MGIIDVWAQHPTERFLADPCFDSLKKWTKQSFSGGVPIELTVQAMQLANVDKALLAAWYNPTGALISNEEVLDITQAYPDVFEGLVSVDLFKPEEAVKTIRHYVGEHEFKGVRIVQWMWDLPCTHPLYYPVLSTCVELDVPVCLQVGLTGPLKGSETGKPIHIERIALDFPNLKIVCGHIGYPWHQEMIAYATKFPNVYIDTSAYKPNRYPIELIEYIKGHGREKVMFGTNYPMLLPSACLEALQKLELDDDVLALFLGENAERVFKL